MPRRRTPPQAPPVPVQSSRKGRGAQPPCVVADWARSALGPTRPTLVRVTADSSGARAASARPPAAPSSPSSSPPSASPCSSSPPTPHTTSATPSSSASPNSPPSSSDSPTSTPCASASARGTGRSASTCWCLIYFLDLYVVIKHDTKMAYYMDFVFCLLLLM
ncbi:hypothetical protein PVAP13_5NG406840 [Panicum virgatum]|uniref:Uncharacterized protein n=1 Tax=Panicum virgatum TaxID=38727 RepID=A0A8T0S114_PANVG|nr:hypothetical protein PVAP13_5NG406840 [Panicum virgatum]